jgi:hypothetical protein
MAVAVSPESKLWEADQTLFTGGKGVSRQAPD